MKTKEEQDLYVENTIKEVLTGQYHHTEANLKFNIKQIRLDAMKEGARQAAKIIKNSFPLTMNGKISAMAEEKSQTILTVAEQWTGKDI